MNLKLKLAAALTGLLLLTAPLPGEEAADSAAAQGATIVGIDTMTQGNGAATVAKIEPCRRVNEGETFDVDLFVTGDSAIAGFGVRVLFDPSIVNIVNGDASSFLLGPGGLTVGSGFPETTGDWQYAYAQASAFGREGVLMRISLKAVGSGSSPLDLPVGPVDTGLFDEVGQPITITGIVPGEIRVGSDCPPTPAEITPVSVLTPGPGQTTETPTSETPGATPPVNDEGTAIAGATATAEAEAEATATATATAGSTASDNDDDGDGFPLWAIVPIAGGVALAAAGAVFGIQRLRRRGQVS